MLKRSKIILLILLFTLLGCQEPSNQLDYQIHQQTASECTQKGENHTEEPDPEITVDGNMITIKNHQAIFRCCGEKVDFIFSIKDGEEDTDPRTIEIWQQELTGGESCDDCLCLRDVDLKFKLFDAGRYLFKIYRTKREKVYEVEKLINPYGD